MPPPGSDTLKNIIDKPATPEVRKAIAVDQVTEQPVGPVVEPLTLSGKLELAKDAFHAFQIVRNHVLGDSWKTSLFGVGGLGTTLLGVLNQYLNHQTIALQVVALAVIGSLGLMFAKDAKAKPVV